MGLSQILESAFCYLQQSLFYYYFNMYIRSDRLLKGGENVKFIHTGDIHWGMSPDSDKPWSRERSRDIRDTFTAIIAKAKELRVDCLFIAGVARASWMVSVSLICSTASRCCAT